MRFLRRQRSVALGGIVGGGFGLLAAASGGLAVALALAGCLALVVYAFSRGDTRLALVTAAIGSVTVADFMQGLGTLAPPLMLALGGAWFLALAQSPI